MKTDTATSTSTTRPSAPKTGSRRPAAWRRFIPHIIGGALVSAIVLGMLPKPTEVEIAPVTTGPLTVNVLEEGKTRIRHRYIVSAPVGAHLNRVELRAGAPIEAGKTVLATLTPESSSFLNPRAQAEGEARVKAAESTRMMRETQVERAKAALDLAQKEMARARELKKSGSIATKEWDTAESQANVLSRELHMAEFTLQTSDFELAQAKATLQQAQSPVPEKVEPLKIIAPVDGFILNVFEESARVVTPGMPIMEVGDPRDMEAEIELLSSDAAGVQPGADVAIEQWGGDQPLRGRVTVVEPGGYTKVSSLGVEEQRVKVRVDFVDPVPAGYLMGDRYRVEARIVTWHAANVLQVPAGALFRRGGDWMTFVARNGKAHLTKVEVAHLNGIAGQVVSGLNAGQTVVLHPPDVLTDGSSVKARR
jgi:HlyD family secretion protein